MLRSGRDSDNCRSMEEPAGEHRHEGDRNKMPPSIAFETTETLTATVRNDMSELGPLAEALGEFGLRNNVPADAIYKVDLALEELLVNVIRHGYGEGADDREIRVGVALADGAITVRMEDDAMAFDPRAAAPPDIGAAIEKYPCQGLGLYLVGAVMDSIAYERRDGRNCLTLCKAF